MSNDETADAAGQEVPATNGLSSEITKVLEELKGQNAQLVERLNYLETESKDAYKKRDAYKKELEQLKKSPGNGEQSSQLAELATQIAEIKASTALNEALAASGMKIEGSNLAELRQLHAMTKPQNVSDWLAKVGVGFQTKEAAPQAPAKPVASGPAATIDSRVNLSSNPLHIDKAVWLDMKPSERIEITDKYLQGHGFGSSSKFQKR